MDLCSRQHGWSTGVWDLAVGLTFDPSVMAEHIWHRRSGRKRRRGRKRDGEEDKRNRER